MLRGLVLSFLDVRKVDEDSCVKVEKLLLELTDLRRVHLLASLHHSVSTMSIYSSKVRCVVLYEDLRVQSEEARRGGCSVVTRTSRRATQEKLRDTQEKFIRKKKDIYKKIILMSEKSCSGLHIVFRQLRKRYSRIWPK